MFNVGDIIQNIHTKYIYVVVGYDIEDKYIREYIVFLTELYVGKKFRWSTKFSLDDYFIDIRNSLIETKMELEPLSEHILLVDHECNFTLLDSNICPVGLFSSNDIKKWYLKSKLLGLNVNMYLTKEEVNNAFQKKELEEKERREKEKQDKLSNVVFAKNEDLIVGAVYQYPESGLFALYLGINNEKKYIMLILSNSECDKLKLYINSGDEVKLYQLFLRLIMQKVTQVKRTSRIPKVENKNVLGDIIPIYSYTDTSTKLALLKLGLKI